MIEILIALGCIIETTPGIVAVARVEKPLADEIDMNEIRFCIMMTVKLGIGIIIPPPSLDLFVLPGFTCESVLKIAARAVPVVFFVLPEVLLIARIPAIPPMPFPRNPSVTRPER